MFFMSELLTVPKWEVNRNTNIISTPDKLVMIMFFMCELLTMPKWRVNRNFYIISTPSDKSGVVVIMDSTFYNNKIRELLNDQNTYKTNFFTNH